MPYQRVRGKRRSWREDRPLKTFVKQEAASSSGLEKGDKRWAEEEGGDGKEEGRLSLELGESFFCGETKFGRRRRLL